MQKKEIYSMKSVRELNRKLIIRILLIFLIILSLIAIMISRFSCIEADPDVSISKLKGAYITDEGWKSGNSINKYLSNNWMCNDKNDILLWPVMPILEYVSFKIFGLSLFSLRLPSVILSTLLIILLGYFIYMTNSKDNINKKLLILIVYLLLAGTNYYLYIQGRIAFFDIPMSTIGLASLLILYKAIRTKTLKKKYIYYVIHGFVIAICVCIKTTGLIFFLTPIVSLLIMNIINKSNEKYNVRGFIISFIVMVCATISILFIVNYKITGDIFTIPAKYIFNPEAVHSSQLHPLLIIKNYLRFFTNNIIINNLALFLLMLISILITFNESMRKGIIEVSDSIMLSLTISSFLFLGFFTPQAERYFVVLLIPMLYFIPKLIQYAIHISDKYRIHWSKERITLKSLVGVLILLIMFSNIWNIWKMEDYLRNKKYSLLNTALLIKQDIDSDVKRRGKVSPYVMVGMTTSTLAVINNIPFTYHLDNTSENYYFITNESNELADAKYMVISQYKIFSIDEPELLLYLLIPNNQDKRG
ncbi:hypothetical protein D4R71_07710 [bacterium]|nr:MAG: hypothetical protein D4R71_07710 [bacterium]